MRQMTNKELLESLHADLKRVEATYQAHAAIEGIIKKYQLMEAQNGKAEPVVRSDKD